MMMAHPLYMFLLFIAGALGTVWNVTYNPQKICVLNGSTVLMNAAYTNPARLTVKETFWIISTTSLTDLLNVSGYSGRVEYLGKQPHTLKLSNVKKTDELEYFFRITTHVPKERWIATPGVTLNVTELIVIPPPDVKEGQLAILKCKTTCNLTDPSFIWYKDGHHLTTKITRNNQLCLQTVSSEDAGRYSCAVKGYEHLPSPARTLSVRYSPKNVSVSISPSGEVVEGGSVTLTCSGDAHPPVKNYTWFKGDALVGNESTYTVSVLSPEDSGEYKCKGSNDVGEEDSTVVTLNVRLAPSSTKTLAVAVAVCVVVLLIIAVLYVWKVRRKGLTTVKHLQQDPPPVNTIYSVMTEGNPLKLSNPGYNRMDEKKRENDVQYANVTICPTNAAYRTIHRTDLTTDKDLKQDPPPLNTIYSVLTVGNPLKLSNPGHIRMDEKNQESDVQYADVTANAAYRSGNSDLETPSVIYSSVK